LTTTETFVDEKEYTNFEKEEENKNDKSDSDFVKEEEDKSDKSDSDIDDR
jgi:hypothetical protein